MGWKASMLIVNNPTPVDHQKLLQDMGFANLNKIEDESFNSVIYPEDGRVYIGTYKGNLIICSNDFAHDDFLKNQEAKAKQVLASAFPSSEICAIALHSGVNLWSYAVMQHGKTLRARAGSSEDGTFVEIGEPLEEEKELLSKSTVGKNGKRTYILRAEDADDPYQEDQVGENFVFAVCKRYFGHELDHSDDEMYDTRLTGYSYKKDSDAGGKWKKWVFYILIFLLIVAWKIYRRTH